MDRKEFEAVLEEAAKQRDCEVVDLKFDDDDNVFEVTLDKRNFNTSFCNTSLIL